MADEHSVSGAEHTGPEPSETDQTPRPVPSPARAPDAESDGGAVQADIPGPLAAAAPDHGEAAVGTGPGAGTGELIRVANPAPRVLKPDVKDSTVLALAVVILAFTGIAGVSIWAAASFDGGVPGVTGPADGHREPPVIPPADRTRPPTAPAAGETAPAHGPGESPVAPAPRGGTEPQSGRDNDRAPTVDWAAVPYPQDCGGVPPEVREARPVTQGGNTYVVQARCAAGSGTAPDALYTYTVTPDAPPVLARTLIAESEDRIVESLDIRDGRITATLLGWSGPDVPRYAPDVRETRVLTP